MCEYCNIKDYNGEDLIISKMIDGAKQHFEIYLLDNVETDKYNLYITGVHTSLEIEIKYCPICGRKL